jgi:hypothetical protein
MRFYFFNRTFVVSVIMLFLVAGCQKTGVLPSTQGVAALTVVDAIPGSLQAVPVINSGSAVVDYFSNAQSLGYGQFWEYSPVAGKDDTVYVVQLDDDTLNLSSKNGDLLFYGVLDLKQGGIYSLFLTGADTSSTDYLLTMDSLPYYPPSDSSMGIRFVNLSTGSNPISVNLEGNAIGSEVSALPYKGITGFKNYANNSTVAVAGYEFVFWDTVTGDSIGVYTLNNSNGLGLTDPNNSNNLLTFRNVTICIYGSEAVGSNNPLSIMLVDDY